MGSHRENVSDWELLLKDFLPRDFRMGQTLEVEFPPGVLIARCTSSDSEIGYRPAWTYTISSEGTRLVRVSCFGSNPRADLCAGLRTAVLKLTEKQK